MAQMARILSGIDSNTWTIEQAAKQQPSVRVEASQYALLPNPREVGDDIISALRFLYARQVAAVKLRHSAPSARSAPRSPALHLSPTATSYDRPSPSSLVHALSSSRPCVIRIRYCARRGAAQARHSHERRQPPFRLRPCRPIDLGVLLMGTICPTCPRCGPSQPNWARMKRWALSLDETVRRGVLVGPAEGFSRAHGERRQSVDLTLPGPDSAACKLEPRFPRFDRSVVGALADFRAGFSSERASALLGTTSEAAARFSMNNPFSSSSQASAATSTNDTVCGPPLSSGEGRRTEREIATSLPIRLSNLLHHLNAVTAAARYYHLFPVIPCPCLRSISPSSKWSSRTPSKYIRHVQNAAISPERYSASSRSGRPRLVDFSRAQGSFENPVPGARRARYQIAWSMCAEWSTLASSSPALFRSSPLYYGMPMRSLLAMEPDIRASSPCRTGKTSGVCPKGRTCQGLRAEAMPFFLYIKQSRPLADGHTPDLWLQCDFGFIATMVSLRLWFHYDFGFTTTWVLRTSWSRRARRGSTALRKAWIWSTFVIDVRGAAIHGNGIKNYGR
ncbi:hypothetical protein C8J57DRAFT_1521146 [Mycena rebaudengoi]|nr:hypothetical protein C8J57DRAFT_1521146 [Mycena rebaudengoi]